jgi:hypothetical protein
MFKKIHLGRRQSRRRRFRALGLALYADGPVYINSGRQPIMAYADSFSEPMTLLVSCLAHGPLLRRPQQKVVDLDFDCWA